MLNYGPWASHQCFNYERYNSDLKGIKTNGKKGLERTLVKRMLTRIHRDDSCDIPPTGKVELDQKLKRLYSGNDIRGNREKYVQNFLQDEINNAAEDNDFDLIKFISFSGNLDGIGYEYVYGWEQLPIATIKSLKFNGKGKKMDLLEYQQLVDYYSIKYYPDAFFPETNIPFELDTDTYTVVKNQIVRFNSVKILGHKYNSKEATSKRGNVIFAYYKDENIPELEHQLRPAEIQYFFRHDVCLKVDDDVSQEFTFTFAYVKWFDTPQVQLTTYNSINSSTYSNTFLPDSHLSILPIHAINSPAGIYFNILENYNIIIQFHRKITDY